MSQSKAINCYHLKDVNEKTTDNTKGYEGSEEWPLYLMDEPSIEYYLPFVYYASLDWLKRGIR